MLNSDDTCVAMETFALTKKQKLPTKFTAKTSNTKCMAGYVSTTWIQLERNKLERHTVECIAPKWMDQSKRYPHANADHNPDQSTHITTTIALTFCLTACCFSIYHSRLGQVSQRSPIKEPYGDHWFKSFYRSNALPVTQPTVLEHWTESLLPLLIVHNQSHKLSAIKCHQRQQQHPLSWNAERSVCRKHLYPWNL